MNLLKSMICTAILICAMSAQLAAKELIILVDVSASNPMLVEPAFNKLAATHAAKEILALKAGDTVTLQTFGSLNNPANYKKHTKSIGRHTHKKEAVAIKKYLLAMPQKTTPQNSTNLLAWFDDNSKNCHQGDKILIITDGIEASEYIDPNHFLTGKQSLSKPSEFVNLRGCAVAMFGIGVGAKRSAREKTRLRKAWATYFEQAGATFTVTGP